MVVTDDVFVCVYVWVRDTELRHIIQVSESWSEKAQRCSLPILSHDKKRLQRKAFEKTRTLYALGNIAFGNLS